MKGVDAGNVYEYIKPRLKKKITDFNKNLIKPFEGRIEPFVCD